MAAAVVAWLREAQTGKDAAKTACSVESLERRIEKR
jgi:hypothetical protein